MTMSLLRQQHSHGKQRLRRYILRWLWKTAVTARMWRAAVDCSRHEVQQPVKLVYLVFLSLTLTRWPKYTNLT